jgi:hypothetical protein
LLIGRRLANRPHFGYKGDMSATLPAFLTSLFADGRVRVPLPGPLTGTELAEAGETLAGFEAQYRQELPGTPPALCLPAARWAATMFYRACQFVAYRDVDAATIAEVLGEPLPTGAALPSKSEGDSPIFVERKLGQSPERKLGQSLASVHYSVDLTFRYLPDLVTLARTAAEQDPLVDQLLAWGSHWPLSSVGIGLPAAPAIDGFAGDGCLLRLYVDRVLGRRDRARLADRRVREAVRQAVGAFAELAPEMAAAVEELEKADSVLEGAS